MNVNGNDITIEIASSAQKATNQINELVNAIKRLSSESGRVKNPLSEFKGKTKIKIDSSDADKATKKMTGLQKVFSSFKRIAFYRAIRSAIRFVTDGFKEGLQNAYQFSKGVGGPLSSALDNLSSAGFKMKNQLGAAFGQLLVAVTPILLKLIDIVTAAANAVIQFFALLSGQSTYKKATNYWKAWGDAAGGAGKSAKEALKYLAPFDELNVLPSASSSGGGGGTSPTDYENMFEFADIDTNVSNLFGKVKEIITSNIDDIKLILGGATTALGAIFALTGANVPLGLAMMAVGFLATYGVLNERWGDLDSNLEKKIQDINMIVAGASVAIGMVLAFSGSNIPLGLAMIAAGVTTVAPSVLNWDGISDKVKEKIATISTIASYSMLGLGLILAFSGANIPVGIALIAGGIASQVTANLNWDTLPNNVQQKIDKISIIAGGSLIALGAILAFTGVGIPLGIAMMAAGGVSLISAAHIDWDALSKKVGEAWDNMKKKIKEKWDALKNWWKGLSLDSFKIKIPHISWTSTPASGWIANVLSTLGLPTSLPKLNVSWYARGGIVDKASLIGAGEAGKEAIVPLERNTQWVGMVASQLADQLGNRNSGGYNADLADDLEDANGVVVNAIFSATAEIVRAMSRNSGNGQNNSIDIDAVARQVTRWQNNRARAAGI